MRGGLRYTPELLKHATRALESPNLRHALARLGDGSVKAALVFWTLGLRTDRPNLTAEDAVTLFELFLEKHGTLADVVACILAAIDAVDPPVDLHASPGETETTHGNADPRRTPREGGRRRWRHPLSVRRGQQAPRKPCRYQRQSR